MTAPHVEVGSVVAPGDAMCSLGNRRRKERKRIIEPANLVGKESVQRSIGVISAPGRDVDAKLMPLRHISLDFGVFSGGGCEARRKVHALTHAFPIFHRAAGRGEGILQPVAGERPANAQQGTGAGDLQHSDVVKRPEGFVETSFRTKSSLRDVGFTDSVRYPPQRPKDESDRKPKEQQDDHETQNSRQAGGGKPR